jgi:hypothetical protein
MRKGQYRECPMSSSVGDLETTLAGRQNPGGVVPLPFVYAEVLHIAFILCYSKVIMVNHLL